MTCNNAKETDAAWRAAVWSDDSTPEEIGIGTSGDAAHFVSRLRAVNAALLAACEEGLEACEWVADNVSLSDPQAMRFTIDQLRAARDKARGKS